MKTLKSKEMDMLNGGLAGKLILFSLPLAFSSILQQLFNSADVAVVGRFAGDNALAAVGSCVALVILSAASFAMARLLPFAFMSTLPKYDDITCTSSPVSSWQSPNIDLSAQFQAIFPEKPLAASDNDFIIITPL